MCSLCVNTLYVLPLLKFRPIPNIRIVIIKPSNMITNIVQKEISQHFVSLEKPFFELGFGLSLVMCTVFLMLFPSLPNEKWAFLLGDFNWVEVSVDLLGFGMSFFFSSGMSWFPWCSAMTTETTVRRMGSWAGICLVEASSGLVLKHVHHHR